MIPVVLESVEGLGNENYLYNKSVKKGLDHADL